MHPSLRALFAMLLLLSTVPSAAHAAPPCLGSVLMWGTTGSGNGQFVQPFGISIPGDGTVFVTDQVNGRVEVFNEFGGYVNQWVVTPAPNEISTPTGICVSNGVVWVSLHSGHQVKRYTTAGAFLGFSATPLNGWNHPVDIAADAAGDIYVCDSGNNRVVKLAPSGAFLMEFPTGSTPYGIDVHPSGDIYVGLYGGHMVQRFSSAGALIQNIGGFGTGPGMFRAAEGITHDASGDIYVCDTGNDRVQKLSPTGVYLCEFGITGTAPDRLDVPSDLAIGSDGDVFVVEYANNRIQRFGLGPVPTAKTSWGRIKALYR